LPVDNKKSVINSVGKSSKNPNSSGMWRHYCDKNNHNMDDWREIFKFNQQKKSLFEAKAGSANRSLVFLFKETNELKKQLKPEKSTSKKKIKED
jgi:hypothetical protein